MLIPVAKHGDAYDVKNWNKILNAYSSGFLMPPDKKLLLELAGIQ